MYNTVAFKTPASHLVVLWPRLTDQTWKLYISAEQISILRLGQGLVKIWTKVKVTDAGIKKMAVNGTFEQQQSQQQ